MPSSIITAKFDLMRLNLPKNSEFTLDNNTIKVKHSDITLKSEIERVWENGNTVIFDVDVIGGLNLKRIFGDNALAIFVQPPSYDELEKRLRHRSTETEEKIQQRMSKAITELSHAEDFDQILVNDNLEKAFIESEKLVKAFITK